MHHESKGASRSWRRTGAGLLTPTVCILTFLGCATDDITVPSARLRPLLELPNAPVTAFDVSSDGALFAVAGGVLYRALGPSLTEWERHEDAGVLVTDIFAASAREVFAISQRCNQVLRWTEAEGWRDEDTPVKDSVWESGHTRNCIPLYEVWGRGPNDVYVVGDAAAILHYDGSRWVLEHNPLIETARRPVPYSYTATLWSVGGDERYTYAAGTYVLRRESGEWVQLDRPMTPGPPGLLTAVVATGDDVYFGGAGFVRNRGDVPRLLRLANGKWTVLHDRIASFRYATVLDGAVTGQGSGVMWSMGGEVVHLEGDETRIVRLGDFQALIGVGRLGGNVVVAGIRNNRGHVMLLEPVAEEKVR